MVTLPKLDDKTRAVLKALSERSRVAWPEPEVHTEVITIAPYRPDSTSR